MGRKPDARTHGGLAGGGRPSLTRPQSAGALSTASKRSAVGSLGGGGASGVLSGGAAASVEARVALIERSLAPGSALELRLAAVERLGRANAKTRQLEAWGKLWAAINRLAYRLHHIEHAQLTPQAAAGTVARLHEAAGVHQGGANSMIALGGNGGGGGGGGGSGGHGGMVGGAQAFEAAAALAHPRLLSEVLPAPEADLYPPGAVPGIVPGHTSPRLENAGLHAGSHQRYTDALLGAIPDLFEAPAAPSSPLSPPRGGGQAPNLTGALLPATTGARGGGRTPSGHPSQLHRPGQSGAKLRPPSAH